MPISLIQLHQDRERGLLQLWGVQSVELPDKKM